MICWQKKIIYIILLFLSIMLAGCADLSFVSQFISGDENDPESTLKPQSTDPISVILLEPTPAPVSEVEESQSQIIFVSDRNYPGVTEIFLINSDGSGLVQITQDNALNRDPAWSPDQQSIAYTSNRTGVDQIFVLRVTDMEVFQFTELPGGASSPTWSPNGEQIAFIESGSNNGNIYFKELSGSEEIKSIPIDVLGIENIAWAPNGNVIAFSAFDDRIERSNREIFTYDLDSAILTNLTNSPGLDDYPAWTPNGNRLAFHTNRTGQLDIFVMQADGTLQTQLTTDLAADIEPTWSIDGRLLAFSSDREGNYNLFLMDDSGSNQKQLTYFAAEDHQPRWSLPPIPIVDEIAFAAGQLSSEISNIFTISSSDSKETGLVISETSDDTMPDWSPDGSRIVYSSNRSGNYDIFWTSIDNTGESTQLTNHPGPDMHPTWSPDGNRIAFESKREGSDWDIWVINADGSQLRNLTATLGSDQGNPAWSPDGTQIAFSSNVNTDFDIYVINVDGSGEAVNITNLPGDEFFPAWSPDNRLIAFRGTGPNTGKRQIYVVDRNGLGLRPLLSDQFNNDTPDWSPDGQRIVFISDRVNPAKQPYQAQFDVFVYDFNTDSVEIISQSNQDKRYPDWKPRKASGLP